MRIRPYRTLDNVIEGVVITFFDITEMKKTKEMLAQTSDQLCLAVVVRDSQDAILMLNLDGGILAWNPAAQMTFGWTEPEAKSMNIRDIIPQEMRAEEEMKILRKIAAGVEHEPCKSQRLTKDGKLVTVSLTVTPLVDEAGRTYALRPRSGLCSEGER